MVASALKRQPVMTLRGRGSQRTRAFPWRPEYAERERLEVLHDGSEMELVARTGEAPKPHALEAMVGLQMRKPHLDPLSLIS